MSRARELYDKLIEPIRERAKELGYAIGVHGSLERDIDLIACPWSRQACDAEVLAEAIRLVAEKVNGVAYVKPAMANDPYHQAGCPGLKSWGRLTWIYYLGGTYIDLSVMPRLERELDDDILRVKLKESENLINLLTRSHNG